ncbi:hypothetical protein MDAP_002137 [Mitosporidium daphniae]|uniref:Uncharacterized protein n=1 Tax=Mitosporidium daphniae TaxID=1485682 RepID=A0A098VTM1_9MICR|nr:uncharacterized protein DI09_18p60 [Mitosporidium daphniae]KGG52300.1 hypothetical protein DI09_18p60 [Mitosporidium daphniae]|eukprot:XP_013238761.1 uncharacterized protein DI09_18p60 [Mitosporidium daphniae]
MEFQLFFKYICSFVSSPFVFSITGKLSPDGHKLLACSSSETLTAAISAIKTNSSSGTTFTLSQAIPIASTTVLFDQRSIYCFAPPFEHESWIAVQLSSPMQRSLFAFCSKICSLSKCTASKKSIITLSLTKEDTGGFLMESRHQNHDSQIECKLEYLVALSAPSNGFSNVYTSFYAKDLARLFSSAILASSGVQLCFLRDSRAIQINLQLPPAKISHILSAILPAAAES